MNKIICTLDPHRMGDKLALSQGNVVVTTTDVCDFHRAVFGNIAIPLNVMAFECYFWSTSNPASGLVNMCSVGIVQKGSSINKYVGEESTSYGLRTSDGAGNAGIYNNNGVLTALPQIAERQCIGVLLNADISNPYVSWQVNGNYLGQVALPTGKFWLPAISIGSGTPGDVSAYFNAGQHPFDCTEGYIVT